MVNEITVIHGVKHHGSTYCMTKAIIDSFDEVVVHEFFLPDDEPDFCIGCFNCIINDEKKCPHYLKVSKIVDAINNSRIIIDSPTYCFEMSGQLKTLFDHLAYCWMPHRPNALMFNKIGIVVSSSAGAGNKRVVNSIANQLFWLGVPKVFKLSKAINAMNYNDVSLKIKHQINKKAKNIVKKTNKNYRIGIKQRFIYSIMKMSQKNNTWNKVDKEYWQEKGWLNNKYPWD